MATLPPHRVNRLRSGLLAALAAIPLVMTSIPAQAAATNNVAVSATVISKSNCRFTTATSTLNFGALDPGSGSDVTASTTIGFTCRGSAPVAAFTFTSDDGLYETGPGANRMRHTVNATDFLAYSLALSPATGTIDKNTPGTLTVTGTVAAVNYQSARVGNYSDTVVIGVLP